jgi:CBS domain containing-hemolysin-like protein
MISGRVEVDYVNEKYELDIPNGDYETVGGFITSKLGRIPQQGENVTIDRFNFLIARASLIKIDVVKLVVNPDFSPESR